MFAVFQIQIMYRKNQLPFCRADARKLPPSIGCFASCSNDLFESTISVCSIWNLVQADSMFRCSHRFAPECLAQAESADWCSGEDSHIQVGPVVGPRENFAMMSRG